MPTPIGRSAPFRRAVAQIERVAPTRATVLLTGPSGSGKEVLARHLHDKSGRAPWVALNCAALPSELVESELFGHEKGAFTGAAGKRAGAFEAAHGGTLFLDEIGDLSLAAQAKVLRVLQEREVVRVGGRNPIGVDVRVVAATHRQLPQEVKRGRFREDLYYRLAAVEVEVPPLRKRRADIPLLVEHLAGRIAQEEGVDKKAFTEGAMKVLSGWEWPGNVRELGNVVTRLLVFSEGEVTEADVRRALGLPVVEVGGLFGDGPSPEKVPAVEVPEVVVGGVTAARVRAHFEKGGAGLSREVAKRVVAIIEELERSP